MPRQKDHVARIKRNFTFLIEDLDLSFLLDYLFEKDVFELDELEQIRSKAASRDQNRAFLERLMKKDAETYAWFREGLRKGQEYIGQHLDADRRQSQGPCDSLASTEAFHHAELNVALIGDSNAGKTTLLKESLNRAKKKSFESICGTQAQSPPRPTTNLDIVHIPVKFTSGKRVQLKVWDTVGTERYQALNTLAYKKCSAAIFLYDITDKMSFHHVPEWIRQFQNLKVDAPIAIVGNKLDLDRQCQRREAQGLARATSDLELTRSDAFYEHSVDDSLTRKISVDDLHRLAEKHNAMFMEVSAKTQFQVEEMFRIVTDGILEHQRRQQLAGMEYGVEVGVIQPRISATPRKRKCCS